MRNTLTLVATLLFSITSLSALAQPPAHVLYSNEQQIEFKANSGETTDAIEGYLFVPENRNNPDSRKIRVNYVRFPATGNKKGPPIVYLSGGPGGSGIGTAKWRRFPLFMALREFGDVIALDQRGTGLSEQTERCTSQHTLALDEVITPADIKQIYQRAVRQCFNEWQSQGIDVYGYTSNQNALDLNDLRVHLQAEKVSLWGISYGSHLAFAAMKLFPEHIEKVIIASAEGLDQTVKLPEQTDAYFDKVQKVIDQQALKEQIHDLPKLIHRVHQALKDKPLQLTIPQKDGSNVDMLFQQHHMQMLASMMIADPNQYLAMLLQTYWGLDNNNTDMLTGILQRGMFKNAPLDFRLMPLAMDIASGISTQRLATVTQQARNGLLGEYLNFPMPMLDGFDPKLDLGQSYRMEVESDIPTLLFKGSLDGRTYPEEQANAVQGLSMVTQIDVINAGHNLYTASPEVLKRMRQFLANQSVDNQAIVLPLPDLMFKPRP